MGSVGGVVVVVEVSVEHINDLDDIKRVSRSLPDQFTGLLSGVEVII